VCGIFFSVGFPPDPAHIDVVAYRGPDGRGWRVFESPAGPVALGHRRLSIIDLDDRALQPMASDDGRLWLTYNGEIYNYIELREELKAAGVSFRTESDSEVLLKAYTHWGARALDRLVGMFAFVIWDDQKKKLFVARDHFGIKPVVYYASPRGLAVGSEIKQLIDLPGFSRRINIDRSYNFLESGVSDHLPSTLFSDAFNLAPGRYLELDLNTWRLGDALPIREYWRLPDPAGEHVEESDAAEQFRSLFLDSIRLQMRSDVRVGSCLSGGLDSSSVVAAQAASWPPGAEEKLSTVSAVFPGHLIDETPFIDAVIEKTGATSSRVTIDPHSVFSDAEAIVRAQGEPYGSTSIHAQYHVFRRARELGIKVMLDGQGADELLGGYHGCFHYHYARLIRQARIVELLETLAQRKTWHGLGYREQLATVTQRLPPALRAFFQPSRQTASSLSSWTANAPLSSQRSSEGGALAQALAHEGLASPRSLGDYCLVLTRLTSLPMLLRYEDRSSMAHSIEARVPFLDHRLVEFALRLGNQHKIVGGDTKRVLRRAMSGLLPQEIQNRRDKIGFATPEEAWFKGPLRKQVEAGVEETLEQYPEFFDRDATRVFARQMLDSERPFDFSLWRIVIFGIWGRAMGMSL
jgi:asparagine synthase (glutamine-hydrolysing)